MWAFSLKYSQFTFVLLAKTMWKNGCEIFPMFAKRLFNTEV